MKNKITQECRAGDDPSPLRLPKLFAMISIALFGATLAVQAGQGPQPSICTRACWGARDSACAQSISLTRAVIHHTANAGQWSTTSLETSKSYVRGDQNYHMDSNGWCDIGYHFLIDKLGNIFEGRKNSMSGLPRGTHDGVNNNSFGFSMMGYFHTPHNHSPTTAQRNAVCDVIAWRMPSSWSPYGGGAYGNNGNAGWLCSHRDGSASACPGDIAYNSFVTSNLNGGEARDGVNCRKNGTCGGPPAPSYPQTLNSSIAHNADGRLEMFLRATDNSMHQIWQTTPGGGWSAWYGAGAPGSTSGSIVGRNADGRMQVFVRGSDNAIWTTWQITTGGGWNPWLSFGGSWAGRPALGVNADGRMELFAVSAVDGTVHHKWQLTPGGGWSSWASTGAPGSHPDLCIESNSDGRLQVFARGSDTAVWTLWQTAVNGGWSTWLSFGGAGTQPGFATEKNADGRMQLFVIGSGNAIWTRTQDTPSGGWGGWGTLGGNGAAVGSLAAGKNPDGRVQIFVVGSNTEVWTTWQSTPNSGWMGWISLGGAGTSPQITVANNADGRMQFFVRGSNNNVWTRWQVAPGGGWNPWLNLGGSINSL